jgi:TonB-linked SusC/RagA family outer membrane protein
MHYKQTLKFKKTMISLLIYLTLLGNILPAFAQSGNVKVTGQVIDEQSMPMIGVSVVVSGTKIGTTTDLNGNFVLQAPKSGKTLTLSYIGYKTIIINISGNTPLKAQMKPESRMLNDVVVIGYGTQRKSDLTGSVSNVTSKDFNGGMISSPEQLINGKVSGVQIMSNSGSPTAGSTIRIRGGASLNASNDPLIVLDGVPMEVGGSISGNGNFLSLINPNDIESMTILKDASSTAIYGSRASNGVILITTKKGSAGRTRISFNSTNSLQVRTKLADMMSRDEFISTINTLGTDAQKALIGTEDTNWNDQIYHTAFGTDNNVSVSGKVGKSLPYRVSIGYYNQNGILRTDNSERYTGNLSLSPSFLTTTSN